METKERIRERWEGRFLILIILGVFGWIYLFFDLNLSFPFQLSRFTEIAIILLTYVCIFVPGILFIRILFIYLRHQIVKVWNQLKSDSQSVWNQFLFFFRKNALIIALVLIYVFFYRFWETWIGNHIIEPFLNHFESNLQNDVIFILATIICIVLFYVKTICVYLRKTIIKQVNQQTLIISIIAIVIWAFYRFNHGLCGMPGSAYYMGFTPLSIFSPIKYFDIVLVFAIYQFVSYFLGKFQETIAVSFIFRNNIGLTRNLPIIEKDKDLLERDGFAKSVVEELWGTDTGSGSFTCGIDAPWGSGKTSFINLMKNHLESIPQNKIIIDFNPWLYAAEKDLVTAFFDELSKTLKKYNNSLSKNLIDYAKLLSAFNTSETKLISSLLELVQHDDHSLQEKKKQISEAIKRIKRRIFVFIDDLDRLEANEILEMMKLIRNVSDFPDMYIIAAYDKSYVTSCLSIKMKSSANNFIEKIFEHEHILAPCSNESLRHALADELRKIDSGRFLKLEYEDYILGHNNKALDALSNLREIYRLSNNISSTYRLLKHEDVHGIDLLLLGLFKTKYPVAFSLFEHKWHEILVKVEHDNYQYYEFFQGEDNDSYFDFIQYLKDHKEEMSMNEFDINTIKMILSELFKRQENDEDTHRINDVRWFNRYLNLTQLKSDIPEKEFNEVLNQPIDKIKNSIDNWSVNKSVSLIYRLFNSCNNNQLNREQLVNNIQAVFYYSITNGWNIISDIEIYEKTNSIISHLKEFNYGTFSKEDQQFILDQLKGHGYSDFMCKYVGYLYGQKKFSDISLNEANLIEAQQSIFSDCCKNMEIAGVLGAFNQLLNRESNDLDHNLEITPNDNYAKSLAKSMQGHAKRHYKPFLQFALKKIYLYGLYYYYIRPITTVIWGSWNQFKDDYLLTLDDSDPFIVEFKAFYKKFEVNHYQYLLFDFKSIEQEQ